MNTHKKSLFSQERIQLSKIAQEAEMGLIDVKDAARILNLPSNKAAMKLSAWIRKGWARRIRRGTYFIPALEADPRHNSAAEDPWVIAFKLFSPCYIGGWSAAEHWNLTEQLFRSTLVITTANIRERDSNFLGQDFKLFKVKKDRIKNLATIWRGNVKVLISSKERTISDCLRDPELCGGVRHLAQIIKNYTESKDRNFGLLLDEVTSQKSGAAWKRLGYIFEVILPNEKDLISIAQDKINPGFVKLDPRVQNEGLKLEKWKLIVNIELEN